MIEIAKALSEVSTKSVKEAIPKLKGDLKDINRNEASWGKNRESIPDLKNNSSIMKASEFQEIKKDGGAYKDLPSQEGTQKHHVPADSSTDIPLRDGPCVLMETKDHAETASFGNSKEAQEYRDKQKELVGDGKLKEAFEMDKEDIQSKFNNKYNNALSQVEKYIDQISKKELS